MIQRKKSIFLMCLSSLVLASCAKPISPPATEYEKSSSMQNLKACIEREYEKLEDGLSPADQIALGIEQACHKEERETRNTFSKGLSPVAKVEFERVRNKQLREETTSIVLKLRAIKRGRGSAN
jgi:predicted phage-related endonuclease